MKKEQFNNFICPECGETSAGCTVEKCVHMNMTHKEFQEERRRFKEGRLNE